VATFAELRERFSDDAQKRGKQFEHVCKWFLETDPRYSERLLNVWLWDGWPGRWGPDCGIDLVAEWEQPDLWTPTVHDAHRLAGPFPAPAIWGLTSILACGE
jgi:predicted helicase